VDKCFHGFFWIAGSLKCWRSHRYCVSISSKTPNSYVREWGSYNVRTIPGGLLDNVKHGCNLTSITSDAQVEI